MEMIKIRLIQKECYTILNLRQCDTQFKIKYALLIKKKSIIDKWLSSHGVEENSNVHSNL